MERINDEGQWIVLMGFVVSVSIFFLAFLINQSILVGQTTSEAVLEFPKTEIQDVRDLSAGIFRIEDNGTKNDLIDELSLLSLTRSNSVSELSEGTPGSNALYDYTEVLIHFNNGITTYDESYNLFTKK
ncbi:hypothetical protein [Methanoplanus limicola]|uniref:Uncharacterized protein n=1 Tax=Methanoplanus limicola DSM 2279 TaxID=937775 RepID=H1YXK5_9EURY|nr:hypothetical protein [Methanoplanus limicola]EHQ34974.1 hypothetical protein Metlim_0852 [Methanoplanus limicola DSM 2279]